MRHLDARASAVQRLVVECHAVAKRLERQNTSNETAHKEAERRLQCAVTAMRSLSGELFDIEE